MIKGHHFCGASCLTATAREWAQKMLWTFIKSWINISRLVQTENQWKVSFFTAEVNKVSFSSTKHPVVAHLEWKRIALLNLHPINFFNVLAWHPAKRVLPAQWNARMKCFYARALCSANLWFPVFLNCIFYHQWQRGETVTSWTVLNLNLNTEKQVTNV